MFSAKNIRASVIACILGIAVMVPFMSANAEMKIIEIGDDGVVEQSAELRHAGMKQTALKSTGEAAPDLVDVQDELVSYMDDMSSIEGAPMASRAQCVRYLLSHNPYPQISVSPEELVAYYYEEGEREGIRPDVAFAQALKETGFFSYGGTVVPDQNNYCGLGTTSASVRGAYFPTAQLGVRAHIQHLKAYISQQEPQAEVVDPRYTLVRQVYGANTLHDWEELNGRWAVPGYGYGQSILSLHRNIMNS